MGWANYVALGDSLTAGLGLDPRQAYPALLQQRLDRRPICRSYEVENVSAEGLFER